MNVDFMCEKEIQGEAEAEENGPGVNWGQVDAGVVGRSWTG